MAMNRFWSEANRGRLISIENTPIVDDKTKIFTIGSCFAIEIKRQLLEQGFHSPPNFGSLRVDVHRQFAMYYDIFEEYGPRVTR